MSQPVTDINHDHYFDQTLDHFDRQDSTTFRQRYFVNTSHWSRKPDAPIFMCVGGEGPALDWLVLVSSVHCNDMVELAPHAGALMVALEHRYYGLSNPFKDYSTKNLQWLSTEQALNDIAYFHAFISAQYNLTRSTRWVTFGGSYPGILSALSRLRFPHLFYAAVASSAPLDATVEMVGYNDVVAQSMSAVDVGGSEACLSIVKDGHAEIGKMLKSAEGISELEKAFNVCKPGTLNDVLNQKEFAGDGVVSLPIQENDPACTEPICNIASICQLLTNSTKFSNHTNVQRLAYMADEQNGGKCIDPSYKGMLSSMADPTNYDRTWLYQTCTEWGFYQTCDVGTQCPYTQGLHTLSEDLQICKVAFDLDATEVWSRVQFTNVTYGGRDIQGSRIMFVNGQIDPWHANSVLKSPNGAEPTHWTPGASHHFWTHPSLPTDQKSVVKAREAIWSQVGHWLRTHDLGALQPATMPQS